MIHNDPRGKEATLLRAASKQRPLVPPQFCMATVGLTGKGQVMTSHLGERFEYKGAVHGGPWLDGAAVLGLQPDHLGGAAELGLGSVHHLAAVLGIDHGELAVLVDVAPDVLDGLFAVVVDAEVDWQVLAMVVNLRG